MAYVLGADTNLASSYFVTLIFPLKILTCISKKVSIFWEKVEFLRIENNDLIRNFKVYLHFKKPTE